MCIGLPRFDRVNGLAGSDQQSRRSNPRLLYRLADLGKCNRRDRAGRRIELFGQPQAFRLAVVRGNARHHTDQ